MPLWRSAHALEAADSNREWLLEDRIHAGEAACTEEGFRSAERTVTRAKGMNNASTGDSVGTKLSAAFDRIRFLCANLMHYTQDRIPVNRALHKGQADFGLICSGCL